MKSYLKILYILIATFLVTGCVHDDIYTAPDFGSNPQCQELQTTMSVEKAKALATNVTFTSDDVIEGYVSSTDETGNIYKYIYVQDNPTTPTQGLVISVDAVSTYTSFPQGSKVYIKLKGLAMGTYGGVKQLGAMVNGAFDRMSEADMKSHIVRSCSAKMAITPKVMTLTEMNATNDKYIGCLIQVNNAEFDKKVLCTTYAPNGTSVDKQINDATSTTTTKVVRNSGYASFANQMLPAGNGKFVGILSKYNSTYQMFINRVTDLDMNKFPRLDGTATNPCTLDPTSLPSITVAGVKKLISGNLTQISVDALLKAKVTANDETGNLYKYVYVEDATGGIRVNINKTNLYQDARFRVGKDVYIKIKDLYIGNVSGELQLGALFGTSVGQIDEASVYKYFFDSNQPLTEVVPSERTIPQLTTDDIGRWIKIKDLQFIDSELGNNYAAGATTNRTLTDCSGNKIILRTSSFATFASNLLDVGKGDVYAILSYYAPNNQYQLWITNRLDADLDNPRCDGTLPEVTSIFKDGFDGGLNNWTTSNVSGTQAWTTTTFGNPKPSAIMDGNRLLNEDWLVSKPIAIASGFNDVFLSFETDARYSGNPLELYVTDNYTGTPSTTTWTKLTANFDTDLAGYNGFVSSGKISLKQYVGKNVYVAFKYTSVVGTSTTWELDNVMVTGFK